jgi:hypothetical protein
VLRQAKGRSRHDRDREHERVPPARAAALGAVRVPEHDCLVGVAEAVDHRALGFRGRGTECDLGVERVVQVGRDLLHEAAACAPGPAEPLFEGPERALDFIHGCSITALTLLANRSHCVLRPASSFRPRGVIA